MGNLPCVSIVIPLFNECDLIHVLSNRLSKAIQDQVGYRWDVIYVNDGSTDGTAQAIQQVIRQFPFITTVELSRNFGHQVAITAGLDFAQGDAVIVMDGDLQDPPEIIHEMLQQWEAGYDVVYCVRNNRPQEGWFKVVTAKLFYTFLSRMSDTPIPQNAGDFRLMSRPVVDALKKMPERNRYIRGMVSWAGFDHTFIYYDRCERAIGNTKFPLGKMISFAYDGIFSFSKVPLHWVSLLGFAISIMSFLGIIWTVFANMVLHITVSGWSSLMIGILMLGGFQLLCLGIIGEYIGRIFDEVRQRPHYLVKNVTGQSVKPHSTPESAHMEK